MNKNILLVMKWLNDKDSVTQDELKKNRDAATAAYAEAYAATAATAATAADAAAAAEKWINKYFDRTGEDKQEYIDALAGETKPVELIDGDAYQFKNIEDNTIHGIYNEDDHCFQGKSVEWCVSTCTNIKALVVES